MSLSSTLSEVITHLNSVKIELEDLETKQRKSSGPRARKSIQSAKVLLHQLRGDIMNYVKELPTKKRVVKAPDPLPVIESIEPEEPEPVKPVRKRVSKSKTK